MGLFNKLGNLEELILLMMLLVHDEAYGVTVRDVYVKHIGQEISLSAVHTVLRRLEKKGFISSEMGGATTERGGRRKRLYKVTNYGYKTLEAIREKRTSIWQLVPKLDI